MTTVKKPLFPLPTEQCLERSMGRGPRADDGLQRAQQPGFVPTLTASGFIWRKSRDLAMA